MSGHSFGERPGSPEDPELIFVYFGDDDAAVEEAAVDEDHRVDRDETHVDGWG